METIKRIPLHYFSYNAPYVSSLVTTCILFFSFYVILYLMFEYEHNNAKNICDPKFYYGRPCRNQIANRILSDPALVSVKHNFYDTMQQVNSSRSNDRNEIENAAAQVQTTLMANTNFAQDTIQQIEEVTDIANAATARYLGNVDQTIQSTQNTSPSTWAQLQTMPALIQNLQSQIQQSVITPAMAPYVGPLKKLYQSLLQLPISNSQSQQ